MNADETHVTAAPDGSLIVAAIRDSGPSSIVRLSLDGSLTTVISDFVATALSVRPDGAILAVTESRRRIALIRNGVATFVAGSGTLGSPTVTVALLQARSSPTQSTSAR